MTQSIKNQKTKDIWTNVIPSYSLIILWAIFIFFSYLQQKKTNDLTEIITDNIDDTTWAVAQITTWDTIVNTWVSIPIPEDPREYLEYIMEDWEWWVDYIVATPADQPKMNSKNSAENTEEMHMYIHKNRIKFDFDSKNKKWYIMFITTKEIPQSRNLFLGVDGVTIWWLDKKATLPTYSSNEYLYELDNIKYFWSWKNFKYKNLSKSPIYINAVVWQAWNKVEKIIIFFK